MFSSPLPSKQLWSNSTYGQLQGQDFLYNGGWWHNPAILSAVGEGIDVEEPRAWVGCWNETIVDLVRLSMQDQSTLTILLTGRGEDGFADLLGRMVKSKGLVFDMVCLKPKVSPNGETFGSTMLFKQALLRDIILTYSFAEEIRVYEDRPKHTKGFRDFFADLNRIFLTPAHHTAPRPPILAEVIQVTEQETRMDPVAEVAEVQRMVNTHNSHRLSNPSLGLIPYKVKRTVFYTGYIISPPDIEKLKMLVQLPPHVRDHDIKYLANNVLITPRPAPASILSKIGGTGSRQRFRITGIANFEQRIWAARVAPVPDTSQIYTENPVPCIVLATRRQTKPIEANRIQNWQPVSPEWENWEFETVVGEKVLLRIEEEIKGEDEWEANFANQNSSLASTGRKHPREEEWPSLPSSNKMQNTRPQGRSWREGNTAGGGNQIGSAAQRGGARNTGQRGGGQTGGFRGRGGRGGGGGGGMQRGRGRGGYRSLDDNVGQGYGGGSMQY